MRLFLHPIRPLSRTGQVVMCAIAAVLGALLMIAWSPAHARTIRERSNPIAPVSSPNAPDGAHVSANAW